MRDDLTAIQPACGEAGRRSEARRKNEIVGLLSELRGRKTGAAAQHRPIETTLGLGRRLRLDTREALHGRSAETGEAFLDEVREEGELALRRLVAGAAVGDAKLELVGIRR